MQAAFGGIPRRAVGDSYFVDHGLYPNLDFYSAVTLRAMGFPHGMFAALFAVARTVGWVSQWLEMIADPLRRIGRPRQLYVGHPRRDYVPVSQREPMRLPHRLRRQGGTRGGRLGRRASGMAVPS